MSGWVSTLSTLESLCECAVRVIFCACYFIWDRPGVSVSGWVSTLGLYVSVGEHLGSL